MAAARRAISKKTRFDVFKRDAFTCQYCGAHPPGVLLHVDHIVAVASGGRSEIDNLATACEPCNLGKGARDLKLAPQTLADKAKLIAEKEAQLLGYQEILEDRRADAAEIAYSRGYSNHRQFRYFCGVCWSRVRDANEAPN
ncbi:MAG: HNH endonuclease [Planctomycetota bacterium]